MGASMKRGEIRIGISGWRYKGWRGKFYPQKLRQKDELRYAAQRFRTIEINGTFYSLQSAKSFARWRNETPDHFVFTVKGSRFLTHIRRLREVRTPLATFFASGLLALESKLGPFLWRLAPNVKFDAERLEAFFELLPPDLESAAELAKRRNKKILPRAHTRLKRTGHCATRWKFATKVTARPSSSGFCASIGLGWCAPTRWSGLA